MGIKDFFSKKDIDEITGAIGDAELKTSGEIRVHVISRITEEPVETARKIFAGLKMHETKHRNGVLILLAVDDHKFVIFGDDGINEKVPSGFWDKTRDVMQEYFRAGRFSEGLIEGVRLAGTLLADFFPREPDDINELPDAITFEEET